uniref:DNA-directed RNA polymerase subunit alpha n=1 Tax=Stigeoclonium helveticum TaxID=55999 RepID=RPOA_STIHE|nr:alpha subunit of RNA polymerase [Stigeoclonium helveticum]Q06SF7.1 RecName: Full=DNA-directed RNA polymerase subunit alpha; Short=PEP; AltName: Full=Plastid-encoded RNA polymerase subunit alpha; Short=RNA polymerase subunit alpha [Stigeoclonium helveticum]ABF60189.1 alpha subunit of RNA polymerase [Stigeoclonium helveticum]
MGNYKSNLETKIGVVKNPILVSCRESIMENKKSFYGRFYIGPLEVGQGITLANALRRALLSELNGLAITTVEIEGVSHEYSTLMGVRESVLDILLNLKQIVLKSKKSVKRAQTAYIYCQGPGVIRAGDIILPSSIQCVDPEQYIATLSSDGILKMKVIIRQGKNYLVQTPNSLFFDEVSEFVLDKNNLAEKRSEKQSFQHKIFLQNSVNKKKWGKVEEKKEPKLSFFSHSGSRPSFLFKTKVGLKSKALTFSFQNSRSLYTISQNSKNKELFINLFKKQIYSILALKVSITKSQDPNNFSNLLCSFFLTSKNKTKPLFIDAVFMPVTKVNYTLEENKQKLFDEIYPIVSNDNLEKNWVKVKKSGFFLSNQQLSFEKNSLFEESKLQQNTNNEAKHKNNGNGKFVDSKLLKQSTTSNFDYNYWSLFSAELNNNSSSWTTLNSNIFFEHFNQSPKDIIILEIWTNGSILPRTALKHATQNLSNLFIKFQNAKMMKNSFFETNKTYTQTIRQLYEKYQNF